MRTRVALLLSTAAVVPLFAAGPVGAATTEGKIVCSGESAIRFTCEVDGVRKNERVELPIREGCDKFRDFSAKASSYRFDASALRGVPKAKFVLLDDEGADLDGESIPVLRVPVDITSKRVRFINRSKYNVDVSYSMRCRF